MKYTLLSLSFLAVAGIIVLGLTQCQSKFMPAPKLNAAHLQGHWVRNDYLSLLEVTKSPILARSGGEFVSSMFFDTEKIEGDSVLAELSFNNHEGGTFYLYLNKTNTGQKSYQINLAGEDATRSYGLQLEYEKDTTLLLIEYDAAQKPSAVYRYSCVSRAQHLPVDAVHYALNQRLFEGTYRIEDTKQKVTFSSDGKVSNWTNYAQYSANTDFMIGDPSIDIISLYRKEAAFAGATDLSFTINGDTLRLYDIDTDDDNLTFKRKAIRHVLFRVR